ASTMQGQARVMTELGVGLSQSKYKCMARQAAKGDARAQSLMNRDWIAVTLKFVDRMGFTPTDIIIPNADSADATPQIRISRETGVKARLPLPDYTAANRLCVPYDGGRGVGVLRDYLHAQRNPTARIC